MGLPSNTNALQNGFAQGYQIGRSLRFRNSASAYLSRTPSVASGFNQWTLSVWLKRCDVNGSVGAQYIIGGNTTSSGFRNEQKIEITSSGQLFVGAFNNGGGYYFYRFSSNLLRDPSAWYHIVVQFDPDNATSANKIIAYINGIQVTWGSSADSGVSGSITSSAYRSINNTYRNDINGGYQSGGGPVYFSDNYLAEMIMVSGSLISPSSFGVYDSNGIWQPIKYTGTYGTNGFYLPFSNTTSTTTLVADASGNGNNWTANNISLTAGTTYDSMIDSPTNSNVGGNFCVWNPVFTENSIPNATMSNGNLKATAPTTSSVYAFGTIGVSTGKWYWENKIDGLPSVGTLYLGLAQTSPYVSTYIRAYRHDTGEYYNGTAWAAYGATYTTGDVIGIALDLDNQTLTFYKNGVSQGQKTSIGLTGITVFPEAYLNYSTASVSTTFGQQPFTYTPPSGYNALNTANLPQPLISNGANYMAATLYTGNGGTQSINNGTNTTIGTAFQPDFIWMKSRNNTYSNLLFDSVRGGTKRLISNLTDAEATVSGGVNSFNSNGMTIQNDASLANLNASGTTYVGWQWKAGGTGVTNTSGTITSTVSANTTAGFSVVTYSGNSATATVGHGLGVAPSMYIVKSRTYASGGWSVYHTSIGATGAVQLQSTSGTITSANWWNNTAPTSSVFSLAGVSAEVNTTGNTYVAYCFAPVSGYSAFGKYTGNGSADGPFVYTGFRPRWVMFKVSSAVENWYIIDSSRNLYNVAGNQLKPNTTDAEDVFSIVDFTSNGFKIRNTFASYNSSGATYIYAAFAENPFSISRAR